MAWSPDPELQKMFLDELQQRSRRLGAAAAAVAAGRPDSVDLTAVRREGHTIKGTARVMGYEAVAVGAAVIEAAWDAIAAGVLEPREDVGIALAHLTESVLDAGTTGPESGTPGLRGALEAAVPLLGELDLPEFDFLPEARPESRGGVSTLKPATALSVPADDLDSAKPGFPKPPGSPEPRRAASELPEEYTALLASVKDWAESATVIVSSARLYTLINRAAASRAGSALLAEMVRSSPTAGPEVKAEAETAVRIAAAIQSDALGLAAVPISTFTSGLPQLVNYLAKKLGKNVELEISGDVGAVVDRRVLEMISEPVRQLVVNALYHGIEFPAKRKSERKPAVGTLSLDVSLDGSMIELVVADDGAGVDWVKVRAAGIDEGLIDRDAELDEAILRPLLFEPGLTTGAIQGGRGDGLARLMSAVEELHGRVTLETWQDSGTRVSIRVPAWQPLHKVLLVRAGGLHWAIPEAAIEHALPTDESGADLSADVSEMDWDGRLIPVVAFADAVGVDDPVVDDLTIVVSHRVGTVALTVGEVEGTRELAVTEAGGVGFGPDHVSGVAPLGDGRYALFVDVGKLIERIRVVPSEDRSSARVLVLDDTAGGRGALSGSLSASGLHTSVANSLTEAMDILDALPIDAVIAEYDAPSASGIAFVEEVRRRYPRMPIVMLSGLASEDEQVRAKKAGVDRFFARREVREGVVVSTIWDLLDR